MINTDTLNKQFAIPGILNFTEPAAGFHIAEISNRHAVARVALQGAQVITWTPKDEQPVIWLSEAAKFVPGKSIRGGVPICWPWFGPHTGEPGFPAHGYARTVLWDIVSAKQCPDASTQLVFRLRDNDITRRHWPHPTPVECQINIGTALTIGLTTRNNSSDRIILSEALHTYFFIGDIAQTRVLGLENGEYLDKVDGMSRKTQHGPITIAQEVDRVYVNTRSECIIEDLLLERRIHIRKQNSASTIVWNPWIQKAEQMGDLGPDGYRHMLCVESGNAAENTLEIAPGETHTLHVSYELAH